ncbi:hypothetical protein IWX90DRAFT_426784 [Phyllosticta citrichinensis]|uniref:DUF7357 domain-containing protein n=1 Tax=Phyllosticta citrichinensis TaxID=1130410 RepID=A0ABR1XYM4_9PEZI
MRLKLTVKRHKLPSIDLLWAVTNDRSKKASTVAALLEEVNAVIPLETEDWDLDDYVVELGDFEALHFQNITSIFTNEDHVTIRPLSTVDRRARYLTGREQINAAGQHLLDGLPFGKPDLRKPDRPPVNIPAPKNPLPFDPGPPLLEGPQREEYSSDDDDDSFSKQLPPTKRRRLASTRSERADKSVHFEDDEGRAGDDQALVALPSDADTEEEFQAGEGTGEESDMSSDSSSETSSDSSSDASSEDDDPVAPKATSPSVSSDSSSDGSDSDSESSSDDSTSNESQSNVPKENVWPPPSPSSPSSNSSWSTSSDSEPEQASSKPQANPFRLKADTLGTRTGGEITLRRLQRKSKDNKHTVDDSSGSLDAVLGETDESTFGHPRFVPRGEGKQKTKNRNRRRKDQKLLRKLQSDGVLSPSATLVTLREFQRCNDVSSRPADQESSLQPEDAIEWEAARNDEEGEYDDADSHAIADLERNSAQPGHEGDNMPSAKSGQGEEGQLEALRQKLLGDLDSMDVDQLQPASSTTNSMTAEATPGKSAGLKSRRARIDLASTRRHLFSALGVRTPRNKEEEDKLRESYKQASAPAKAKKLRPEPEVEEDEQEDVSDPTSDSYKAKLEVTAFECTDPDNVEQIGAPPYPFEQRWDPALLKYCDDDRVDRTEGTRGKKRKRKTKRQSESYDYEATENDVTLNYDEEQEDEAAESQLLQEEQEANEPEDLPVPPPDLTTLKSLEQDDIVPGTVIVYQCMEFSAQTSWAPSLVQRTAEITGGDASGVQLLLAKRDRPQKEVQYDWKGKRLYEKFEMEQDEEEDPDVVECPLTDLIDPKVLRAAPKSASADATEGISVDSTKEASQDEILDESSATGGLGGRLGSAIGAISQLSKLLYKQ